MDGDERRDTLDADGLSRAYRERGERTAATPPSVDPEAMAFYARMIALVSTQETREITLPDGTTAWQHTFTPGDYPEEVKRAMLRAEFGLTDDEIDELWRVY